MKGRTICPKCNHEFVFELKDEEKKHDVICPKCSKKFTIKPKPSKTGLEKECSWEEHGEPRKTVLSKIKPRTKMPMIAAILLICIFVIGATTAFFSETFINSTSDIGSQIGLSGSIEIQVKDLENNSLENALVTINDINKFTNNKGILSLDDVKLGIMSLEVSFTGYKEKTAEILVTPFITTKSTIRLEEGSGESEKTEFDTIGCSFVLIIFTIFALIAFVACLKRQHFDVAIAGSLLSIFSFGFFFVCSILSIITFIIILKSREEFKNGKKGKIF
jgi:DNA-directed RNA polymerase subunit RPC12/RpoP